MPCILSHNTDIRKTQNFHPKSAKARNQALPFRLNFSLVIASILAIMPFNPISYH
jgi:hypothetical protein